MDRQGHARTAPARRRAPGGAAREWLSPGRLGALLAVIAAHGVYLARALAMIRSHGGYGGSPSYARIAGHLLHDGHYAWLGTGFTAYRPPLYPLFLAGMMALAGPRWLTAATVAQAALALLAAFLLMATAWRLFRDRLTVMIVGLLFAADLCLFEEVLAQTEVALFILIEVAFLFVLARERLTLRALVALSTLAGLAHLAHPTGIVLLPLALGAALFAPLEGGRRPWRRVALATLLPFAVLVLPWQACIYRGLGVVTMASSTTSGSNLYKGNNPDFFTMFPYVWLDPYEPWMQRVLRQGGLQGAGEAERERYLGERALAYIRAEPGAFLRRAGAKLVALYSPRPTPLGKADLVERNGRVALANYTPSASPLRAVKTLQWSAVLVGVLLFLLRRADPPTPGTAHAWIAGTALVLMVTLIHVVVTSGTRYRLPLDPPLELVAAAAWARTIRGAAARDTRAAAAA